jgi:glycosyltransferase involved in cell wall biosynthesis
MRPEAGAETKLPFAAAGAGLKAARYTAFMQPVSVIVTELNEIDDIGRVVSSLLAQVPPATEVIVVDGGSTDGTWEWLQAAAAGNSGLIAIRDETCSLRFSAGPVSRGRNVAIKAAKSHIIACADAGCTYAPDWLQNLTAPIVAGGQSMRWEGPASIPIWAQAAARCGTWPQRLSSAFASRPTSRPSRAPHGRWHLQSRFGNASADFPSRCWWARTRYSISKRGG